MPTPASSRAAVVVAMTMIISFCLIGMSRKAAHGSGLISQPTLATLKSLELSFSPAFSAAVLIDIEPNPAIFDHEGNHAAIAEETIPFAHRQNSGPQAGKIFADILFRAADEKRTWHDFGARRLLDLLTTDLSAVNHFTLHDLIQRVPERVVSQNADGDRRIGVRECPGGHSMNFVKFSRNAALTWYSRGSLQPARQTHRHRAKSPTCRTADGLRDACRQQSRLLVHLLHVSLT